MQIFRHRHSFARQRGTDFWQNLRNRRQGLSIRKNLMASTLLWKVVLWKMNPRPPASEAIPTSNPNGCEFPRPSKYPALAAARSTSSSAPVKSKRSPSEHGAVGVACASYRTTASSSFWSAPIWRPLRTPKTAETRRGNESVLQKIYPAITKNPPFPV